MAKILCPECHRVLGDTTRSIDCNINCKWCKKPVRAKVIMAKTTDYFKKGGSDD